MAKVGARASTCMLLLGLLFVVRVAEARTVEQRLADLENQNTAREQRESSMQRKIDDLTADNTSYKARIQSLEDTVRTADLQRVKDIAENTEKVTKDLTAAWLSKSEDMQDLVSKLRNSVDYKLEERLQKVVDDVKDLGQRLTSSREHLSATETKLGKTIDELGFLDKRTQVDHKSSVDDIKKLQNRVEPLEDHKTWASLHIQNAERNLQSVETKTNELQNNFDRVLRIADNIARDLGHQKEKQENDLAATKREITHTRDMLTSAKEDLSTDHRRLKDQVTSMNNVLSQRTLNNSAAAKKLKTYIRNNKEEAEREIGKVRAGMRRLLVDSEHWRTRTLQLLTNRIKPIHNDVEELKEQKEIKPEIMKESIDDMVSEGKMPGRNDLFKVVNGQKKNSKAIADMDNKMLRTTERLDLQMQRLLEENKVLKLLIPFIKDSLPESIRQQMDDLLGAQQDEQNKDTKTPDVRVLFMPRGTTIPKRLEDELKGSKSGGCCGGKSPCEKKCEDESEDGPPKALQPVEKRSPPPGKVDCRLYPC